MIHISYICPKKIRSYLVLSLLCLYLSISAAISGESQVTDGNLKEASSTLIGRNLNDCATKLSRYSGGWCEIVAEKNAPSISSVWPENLDKKIHMVVGPKSVLTAWNSAAYDTERQLLYFMGGGHRDYGGNEVYQFSLLEGRWQRLTDPSPLDFLYVNNDYGQRKQKPWRRLCWLPDINQVPGSSHTYDGLIFSHKTDTLFLYSYGSANGSCIEDKEDAYKNSPKILGDRKVSAGWYEFNPSSGDSRNGLEPLQWRKVFDYSDFKISKIHQSYPASVELPNGHLVFGSKFKTVIYDPSKEENRSLMAFSGQADWGDGLKSYDKKRDLIWSIHKNSLLAFDAKTGRNTRQIKQTVPHGKSLAFDDNGIIYSWNGSSKVFQFDPDDEQEQWKMFDWTGNGPVLGDQRVYGKWQYIKEKDLFVGLSSEKTGVWIYKHPKHKKAINFSKLNMNEMLKNAKIGAVVKVPPGNYIQGLVIQKSLTVQLKDVLFYGVSGSKGIINVKCDGCQVVIEDFVGNGNTSGCQRGNCAGIKVEGKNFSLRIKRAHIDSTVMGILTDNRGGELIVEDSLIENTGLNDHSSEVAHGLYAGWIDKVVITNSTIRRPFGNGHVFKSRAKKTIINKSMLVGMDGRPSRVIDYPCGGELTVTNSILQQGDQTDNTDLISIGTEPKYCHGTLRPSDVSITDSWIIFDRDRSPDERSAKHGKNRLFTWRAPVKSINVSNNKIIEQTGQLLFDEEDKLPNLLNQNQLFSSRGEAGIGRTQIPVLQ
mgnify:CR=1 FL=1